MGFFFLRLLNFKSYRKSTLSWVLDLVIGFLRSGGKDAASLSVFSYFGNLLGSSKTPKSESPSTSSFVHLWGWLTSPTIVTHLSESRHSLLSHSELPKPPDLLIQCLEILVSPFWLYPLGTASIYCSIFWLLWPVFLKEHS